MSKKLKILVVPSDRTGVSYYRSTNPHIALQTMFPDEFHVDIDYELAKFTLDESTSTLVSKSGLDDDKWLSQYDIIHFHRTLGPYEKMNDWEELDADGKPNGLKHEGMLNRCKRLGIATFMDLDDHWAPGPHHPAYQIIKKHKLDKKILGNIKIADNIMTTTSLFSNEIKKVNNKANVFVIPNAINPKEKQFTPEPEKSERIRIGWLGGSSHKKDLELLGNLVGSLRADGLIDKVQFVLCGFDLRGSRTDINQSTGQEFVRPIKPMESVWYEYEKIFTDNYKSVSPEYKTWLLEFHKNGEYENIANEPYRRVWTKPISTYAKNYNLFDISLAPIEENIFNKVKSQLKVIEAGFHKKAIVAQDFGPYQIDLVDAYQKPVAKHNDPTIDLVNGNALLINSSRNHKQWYQHLKRLINNPEYIKILGDNLYNTVTSRYSMDVVTKQRRDIYVESAKRAKENVKDLVQVIAS
jgi:glycosyltransferase involved in cell wall biosynthesis